MKVLDLGVQAQKFLRAFPPPEALLVPFLTPCSTVGLFDHVVVSGGGDHVLVIDMKQARELPDRGSVTPQLIGTDRVWDIIFAK